MTWPPDVQRPLQHGVAIEEQVFWAAVAHFYYTIAPRSCWGAVPFAASAFCRALSGYDPGNPSVEGLAKSLPL
jgi:hypothetical protein